MSSGAIYNHRALQPSASSSAPTPHAGPYPPGPPPPSGYTDRSDRDRDRTMDTRDRAMIVDRERDRALAAMERDRAMIVDKVTERLSDSFEGIKQEFDHLVTELVTVRKERDDYEKKLSTQLNELSLFRNQLFELESQHGKVRLQYEEELSRLKNEMNALRTAGFEREREREREQRDIKRVKPRNDYVPGPMPSSPLPSSAQQGIPKLPPHPSTYERDRIPPLERGMSDRSMTGDRERGFPDRDRDRGFGERDRDRMQVDRERGAYPPTNDKLFSTDQPEGGAFPDDLTIDTISPEWKKEGSDWWAMFNPKLGQQERIENVSLVHTLMHESVVCCVRFSRDGRFLATGCNRTAQIYDTKTGQKTCVLLDENASKTGDLYIRSVCFSPDGKFLATGAEDKQIRIWDIAKRTIRKIFDGHQQEIYSLDFSSDGRMIVSGSGDRTTRVWSLESGPSKVLNITDSEGVNQDAGVTSVAMSPDGRFVAAGSLDTIVRIWDIETGQLVERLRAHQDSVYSVAFTPDGQSLVSGSLDRSLKVWDVSNLGRTKTGEPTKFIDFLGHKDYVLSVAVSHDGKWVVSGSKDRGVQFWDASRANVQAVLQGHKNSVISIDLSRAGNFLATGSGDWQARIWSYTTTGGHGGP